MGFADFYFERQQNFQVKISEKPNTDLKFIVVIPCFNEFKLLETLNSIRNCEKIKSSIEVIIVFNSSEDASSEIVNQNKKSYYEAKNWIAQQEDSSLRFFILNEQNLPRKFAGAGLARKIGMDQAVHRFNSINQDKGILVSLDSDSVLMPNYLAELEKHFNKFSKTNVITSYFEHQVTGDEFSNDIYNAITIYELYLRYYKLALKYTRFPYSFYTIGSCFAVSANAYAKQGGMSRKQAGEDFYFLHKIFPLGNCFEINTTCVYPSSRPSDRVPFGTGPMVKSIAESDNNEFFTYNFDTFKEIKSFLNHIDDLYHIDDIELDKLLDLIPDCIADFLRRNKIEKALTEISKNSSNIESFKKRFFNWFDAFKILKYLNFAHEKYYSKQLLKLEVEKLLRLISKSEIEEKNCKSYLEIVRKIERKF